MEASSIEAEACGEVSIEEANFNSMGITVLLLLRLPFLQFIRIHLSISGENKNLPKCV